MAEADIAGSCAPPRVGDAAPAPPITRRGRRRGALWLLAFCAAVAGFSVALARSGGQVVPVGRPAPAFALPDLSGRLVSLSGYAGHDVVLAFQTVSCTVCDPPWPDLAAWSRAGGPHLRIVAVEVGQPLSIVQLNLPFHGLPVPVLVDPSGGVAQAYGVQELPSFAFIDRRGDLVAVDAVVSRTGLWSTSTWQHYLGLTLAADAASGRAG